MERLLFPAFVDNFTCQYLRFACAWLLLVKNFVPIAECEVLHIAQVYLCHQYFQDCVCHEKRKLKRDNKKTKWKQNENNHNENKSIAGKRDNWEEHPRTTKSQEIAVSKMNEDFFTEDSEEIWRRVLKKLNIGFRSVQIKEIWQAQACGRIVLFVAVYRRSLRANYSTERKRTSPDHLKNIWNSIKQ